MHESRRYSLKVVVLGACLGLGLGWLAGLAVGGRGTARQEPPPAPPPPDVREKDSVSFPERLGAPRTTAGEVEDPDSPVHAPPSPRETADPGTNRTTSREVTSARRTAPEGTVSRERTPEEAEKEAGKIFADFLRLFRGETKDTDDLMGIASRLGEIDRDLAAHFARRYRESAVAGGDAKVRETAFFLSVLAGGEDAAGLIEEVLVYPDRFPEDRKSLLRGVGRPGDVVWSLDRVPLTGPTISTAYSLLASEDATEQRAGAGLLRRVSTPEARGALERLVISEADVEVRRTAIASLGEIGDQTSLFVLEDLLASLSGHAPLAPVCKAAISRIEARLS